MTSEGDIKIPENLKQKIEANQKVTVLLIPENEKLYDEWNKLSLFNEDDSEQ